MRAKILVLVSALLFSTVTIALPARAGSAQPAAASAVPNCLALGSISSGPHMLEDPHSNEGSELARGINALICSAADGATIDIKSWFITPWGAAMHNMIGALRLMHYWHHVRVNVIISRSWYSPSGWTTFRRAFYFAWVGSCVGACMSGTAGSIDHSKWISVSQLRTRNGGGQAVLSTSLNPSPEQFSSGQSGILVVRNYPVYAAFLREWYAYVRCATGRGCDHRVRLGRWAGYGDTHAWFEPSLADPTWRALAPLDCSHGGVVDLMSLYLFRVSILQQLLRLRATGCLVHVLLEHPGDPSGLLPGLHPRCLFNHDKLVIISVGGNRTVIEGSQDQTPNEVLIDDNQMVETTNLTVFRRFVWYFNHEFSLPAATNCGFA